MLTISPKLTLPIALQKISDYVDYYASQTPNAEAAVCEDVRFSYLELSNRVEALGRALLASGVKPGDRVATLCSPHPDYFVAFLAAASIGAIWIGLNPRYQMDELRYVIRDAEPMLLFARTKITGRNYQNELNTLKKEFSRLKIVSLDEDSLGGKVEPYEQFLSCGKEVARETLDEAKSQVPAEAPALIVYTSGTTGNPKGALITHHGLVRCSRVQVSFLRPTVLRILNNLPINHIGCVGDISCYALVAGGTIVFMEKFDAEGSLRVIEKEKVTMWGQVPTMFQLSLSVPNFAQYDLSSVKAIMWSGAAAPRSLIEKLMRICPTLCSSYGMTETVGSVTFAVGNLDMDIWADSVGWPVDQYDLRIADTNGQALRQGEVGEIQVRGNFLMKGYWRRPEATAETLDADGWLHTGDLAFVRPDGAYQVVGRLKEMFKSGGYNVYPREIEKVMESYPGVGMSAVIGVRDELYGEVGHAWVLVDPGVAVSEEAIREHCKKHLANYKIPKAIFISTDLPMLPIGKIDKTALRNLQSKRNGEKQ